MKIMVTGYSGSGKSSLARALGERYGLPVLYLDCVHWLPGWRERPREETREILRTFLDTHSSWVIDGNYQKQLYARRAVEADRIILMNFRRLSCLHRAMKRNNRYHGKNRFSMTEGCPEKFDWEFAQWILWKGRAPRQQAWHNVVRQRFPEKVTELRSQRELDAFYRAEGLHYQP